MPLFKNDKQKKIAAAGAGLAAAGWFLYQQNNSLVTTKITIASERLPEPFKGFKIVHLSDLHQKSYGKNQAKLVHKIKKSSPDLIAFTGDLFDARRVDATPSLTLMKELVKVAPVYYVTGNHEGKMEGYAPLKQELKKLNVTIMQTDNKEIRRGQDKIYLLGVDDPEVGNVKVQANEVKSTVRKAIERAKEGLDEDSFKVLLSHRPDLFSLYTSTGIDVTLSGHAHGGQIRLPFIGGIYTPGQGFFPVYTKGEYSWNNAHMVVSRGLGPTIFPTRLFNRPEIVEVTFIPQYRFKDLSQ